MSYLVVFLLLILLTQGNFKKKMCPYIKLKCTFKERNYCTKKKHCEPYENCCMLGCGKKCYNSLEAMCKLPMEKGPCGMKLLHWWYNSSSQTCQEFTYGGCFANNNNFETEEICLAVCRALDQ